MSKREEDLKFFVDLIRSKVAELSNLCANIEHIMEIDAAQQAPAPAVDTDARKVRIEKCKERVRKRIIRADKKEKGLQYQFMRETWLTRNQQNGGLDVVTHDADARLKMGSFDRKTDRYSDTDPDEIVKAELGNFIMSTFKWLFDEKKQHRIDVVYPYRGQCTVAVE